MRIRIRDISYHSTHIDIIHLLKLICYIISNSFQSFLYIWITIQSQKKALKWKPEKDSHYQELQPRSQWMSRWFWGNAFKTNIGVNDALGR